MVSRKGTFCQPARGFMLEASRYLRFCIRLPYLKEVSETLAQ